MNYRRLALLFGVGALGVGLVAMVYPELVAFSLDRILVSIVGVLALVQALRVIQTRRHSELDEAVTPDPELPFATPAPGEELENVLEGFLDTRRTLYHQNRVRDGLRSATAAVLTQYGGYSKSDAEAALEAGTWTDDRFAAAFLGGENAPTLPVRNRLQRWIRRESPLQRNVRHTVDAIVARAGLGTPSGEDSNEPSRGHEIRREGAHNDTSPTMLTTANEDPDDDAGDVISRASHPTGHWKGVSVVALVGIGMGLLVEEPAVLLAGVVGIGFAAYARSSVLPPGSVSVDRSLDEDRPEMGDDVEVTVTVTNETDRFLPDLRLVDGVPESLAVSAGSPRLGTALGPGETTTFSYTVTARRGVHSFGPTLLVARDLSTSLEEERLLSEETTLTCTPSLRALTESVPLREQATQYVGRVETSGGGDGIEFYATRDYRTGDPLSRIDWNRQARTGELTTVEFREERAATVVLVLDVREAAYLSPDPHTPHAVERAVDAAGQLYSTLTDAGDRVGITALSSEECWLAPGGGVDHAVEARELLATHPAFSPVPQKRRSGMIRWRRQLRKRLSPGTQIVFLTPLCDEYGNQSARRLDEYGYPVTVLSPDPTADRTASHRLSRVARMLRISAVRSAGIPVIDWPQDATVDEALALYNEQWTQ
jgi:uncharacterized protein (DUF58 family)